MIDWTKPIETTTGEPAKLVYTHRLKQAHPYLIEYHNGGVAWVSGSGFYAAGANNLNIRNVPEPPVKIEGYLPIGPVWSEQGGRSAGNVCPVRLAALAWGDAEYVLDLATASEKCPEAFECVTTAAEETR